jgi:GR25 family glycosyltransferase involved in LPS biosynthesis
VFFFRNSYGDWQEEFDKFKLGKVCAYLINLDKATERLNFVRKSIEELGFLFTRISAVDGNNLSREKMESIIDLETYKKCFKMLPEPGTIGCALSHKKSWESFLKSDNEFAIIFEDDVSFDPKELRKTVQEVLKKKKLWDIVSFEVKHYGLPVKLTSLSFYKKLVFYLTNVTHAGCYLINRYAAYQLLQKFYPIKMPVDHYFTSSWAFNLKFAGVEPRIVHQKFGDSQIKTCVSSKIRTPKILISNLLYNIQRAIIHFLYNIKRFCQLCYNR